MIGSSMGNPSIISTLSPEFIFGLIAERDEKRALLARLPADLAELDKKIDAALFFAPAGFDPNCRPAAPVGGEAAPERQAAPPEAAPKVAPKAGPKAADQTRWRSAILSILAGAGGGLAHKEIIAVARQRYDLPPARDGEEKAYYNAVTKLTQSGKVVKHGNLFYLDSTYREAEKAGALPPPSATQRRSGSSPELVVRVLRAHPAGLTGPQLREAVRTMPDAPKSLYEHGQYIYNILAPMMGTGEISKSDTGVYRLSASIGAREKS